VHFVGLFLSSQETLFSQNHRDSLWSPAAGVWIWPLTSTWCWG